MPASASDHRCAIFRSSVRKQQYAQISTARINELDADAAQHDTSQTSLNTPARKNDVMANS